MASDIDTNGLNVNYPEPGKNNSTQGFRNNFTNIKNNLDNAGAEITELQEKAVLKQGLSGFAVDNNMANTLISNAAVQSFRHTTYNLGNSLSGTVLVNALNGDVQYGTVASNTTINFAGWAPTNTESTIKLRLAFANSSAAVTFPSEVVFSENLVENNNSDVNPNGNLAILKPPYNAEYLEYDFTTLDCGNTITIQPTNRPYKATQVVTRPLIPPTGFEGDRNGDIAVDNFVQPITIGNTQATTNVLLTDTTAGFYIDMPLQFSGNTFGGIQAGATYYVSYIDEDTEFAVSLTQGGSNVTLTTATGTMQATPLAYVYMCTGTFDSTVSNGNVSFSTASSDSVTLGSPLDVLYTPYYALNHPVIFSDLSNGSNVANMGLDTSTVYYVKSIISDGSEFTLTRTRTNGVADGPTVQLNDATPSQVVATFYTQGHDIWKRVPLTTDGGSFISGQDVVLNSPANLIMGGGTNGYFLQTDGAGGLSWVLPTSSEGSKAISGITKANPGVVTTTDVHGLTDGQAVTITDVVGMTEVNGNQYYANVITSNTFALYSDSALTVTVDTTAFTTYVSDGYATGATQAFVGGSNTQIQFNDNGSFGGSTNLIFDSSDSNLYLTGTANVTGNIVISQNASAANITSTDTLTANILNAQLIDVNGNLNANNVTTTSGDVTAAANVIANIEVSAPAGNIDTLQSNVIGATSIAAGSFTVPSYDLANVAPVINITTSVSNTNPGFVALSSETGIQAVGTGAGDATALTAHINKIDSYVTLNTNGVSLPKAYAGMEITMINTSNSNIRVYSNTSDGGVSYGNLRPDYTAKLVTATGNSTDAGTWYIAYSGSLTTL